MTAAAGRNSIAWGRVTTRRAAIVGGNRIPFARSNGAVRARLEPGHADRRARRPGRPVRPAGRAARRGGRRRGAQAQPRLQPHPRVGARLAAVARDAGLRRPAGLRHRAGGGRPDRQQDRARPARVGDRRRRRHHLGRARSRSTRTCARCCCRPTAPDRWAAGSRRSPGCGRVSSSRRSRRTPSRGPGCRWASTRRSPPTSGASPERRRTSWRRLATGNLAAAYERGFFDDLLTPFLGLTRDQNLRPDSTPENWPSCPPVFGRRYGEQATMTAGNSTPLTDGASVVLLASDEWATRTGPAGARARCRRRDGGRRLRARRQKGGRAADGAGVRRAPAARPQRADAAGLRLLRDP